MNKLLLPCLGCILVAISAHADSYSITVPGGGYALIANPFSNGNTLDSILPGVPGGSTQANSGTALLEWNCQTDTLITYFYKVGGIGGTGWRQAGNNSTPAGSLLPGQGAILENLTSTNYTYTISGTAYSPVLPLTNSCSCGYSLVSSQTNAPSSYGDITGALPQEGTQLFRYSSGSAVSPYPPQAPNYTVYTYLGGAWLPSTPVLSDGESAWIYSPCPSNSPCIVVSCPTNFNVTCGDTWDFETPNVVFNCCTNSTVVIGTVTNGSCPQTVTRSWLYTDGCGHYSSCSQMVTAVSGTPPLLACASNKTACLSCLLGTNLPDYTVLWDFTSGSGVSPTAALAQDKNGTIYGMTPVVDGGGGNVGAGVVFSINPDGTAYAVIHQFGPLGDGSFPEYGTLLVGADGALYGTTTTGGSDPFAALGAVFRINTDGSGETILHGFNDYTTDGYLPYAGVVQDTNGTLYGTTELGGTNNVGTVYSVSTDGDTYNILYVFNSSGADGRNPYAGVILGTGGMLYGTTFAGGSNNLGTVFALSTNGTETVLHHFSAGGIDGSSPYAGLLFGNDGMLYGTTESGGSNGVGTVFRLDTTGGNYTVLHHFTGSDGSYPYAALVQGCDGELYGTTYQGGLSGSGTAFRLNSDGSGYTVLYSWSGSDGQNPYGGLLFGADGAMYGTSSGGGTNNLGTVFKLSWPGGWNFDEPVVNDPCTTNYNLNVVSTVTTGGCPEYATRTWLLTDDCGNSNTCSQTVTLNSTPPVISCPTNKTVGSTSYCVGTGTPTNTTVYTFPPDPEPGPDGFVQGPDGVIYGTTDAYGTYQEGTVFKVNTDGTGYSLLYNFGATGNDGIGPTPGIVQGRDGALYGTTVQGGSTGWGTVFKINTDGLGYSILHTFDLSGPNSGARPRDGLIQGRDGFLYGTTLQAGNESDGTVFGISTNGTGFTLVHSFPSTSTDGLFPDTCVTQGRDGMLYGVTEGGGLYQRGILFKVSTNGASYTILHHFSMLGGDGRDPYGSKLVQGLDGAIFGTTFDGGAYGAGTIFKINTDGSAYQVLHSFSGYDYEDGGFPNEGLISGCGGALYGVTSAEYPAGPGTIFKINEDGTGFRTLYRSAYGVGDMINGQDGSLYGAGGTAANDANAIFRLAAADTWGFDTPASVVSCSGGGATLTVLSTTTNGSCPQLITQTWQATDRCGNTSLCSQIVSLATPPTASPSPTFGASPFLTAINILTPGCDLPAPFSNLFLDFGDGSFTNVTSATNSIFHTYYALGTYTLTLIMTDLQGFSITNIQPNFVTVLSPFQAWQQQYFYCTNCAGSLPGEDPLGKGMSNTNQFLTGLNPTNPSSLFRITSAVRNSNDLLITWQTAGVRTNALQFATGGAGGNYSTNGFADLSGPVFINVNGDTTANYLDAGAATNKPARYYRVRLVP